MKTAKQWIATIQDKTVKRYLEENIKKYQTQIAKDKYSSMALFLSDSFWWDETPQGYFFWDAIWEHFYSGSGLKTYNDFKHLDKSVKHGK